MIGEAAATWLVAVREVREAARHKALWLTAAAILAASTLLMLLPDLIGDQDDTRRVGLVGDVAAGLEPTLRSAVAAQGIELETEPVADRAAAVAGVEADRLDAAIVEPSSSAAGTAPGLITDEPGAAFTATLRQAIAVEHTRSVLRSAGVDDATVLDALTPPEVSIEVVDEDRSGRVAAASAVSIAVYLLLFIVTLQVANGVAIEKANRVSEVLLPVVAPRVLLFGKVLGVGATALLPVVAGLSPVLVRTVAGGDLPSGTLAAALAGAAWFVLGSGLYLCAAAALGSLVERQEDAGSSAGVLTVFLVGSYLVAQSAADTPLGLVLALVPVSAPMVEPARLALGVSSPLEATASLAFLLVGVVGTARLAVMVYGRGLVHSGQRLRIRDALRRSAATAIPRHAPPPV